MRSLQELRRRKNQQRHHEQRRRNGISGPEAEEDAESARDAGTAERYAAQAGAEGTEGPGRAPPQAGGNRPAEATV